MDCLYTPDLNHTTQSLRLTNDSERHARALRLREGEEILLSNGNGLCATAVFSFDKKQGAQCHIQSLLQEYGEPQRPLILALGCMENRDRMEFAIEKCTELGMTACVPLLTHHSPRKNVNIERLHNKALSAMVQCKRARVPTIHPPCTLAEFIAGLADNTLVILGSAEGTSPIASADVLQRHAMQTIVCVVGAEGGLHDSEMALLHAMKTHTLLEWNIGGRRLRAETAAVSLCAVVMGMME